MRLAPDHGRQRASAERAGVEALPGGGAHQHRPLLEPVTQHDASRRTPIQGEVVDGGPVGVAVDHQAAAVLAQHVVHRLRSHVHDDLALVGILHLALAAHLVGDGLAARERQAQEEPAQPFELCDAAKLLVALVPGAEQIPVAQQHPLAVQLDDAGVAEQGHAGPFGKLAPQEEVAVAVNEIEGHPLLAQGEKSIGHLAVERVGVVVPNPEFEQIPQHIEGVGPGRVFGQKAHQGRRHVGPALAEVNVTDKEGAHEFLGIMVRESRLGADKACDLARRAGGGGKGSRAPQG